MSNKPLIHILILFMPVLCLLGCKPGVPDDIIQPDDMEDILYDYQLADAMSQQTSDYGYNQVLYREAVFKKHGVTSADFDSSMVYYMRHTELLHKIYESLSERYRNEALALGASESEVNRYSSVSSSGDTANVWNGDMAMILMPQTPYNVYSYDIVADSTYRDGDSFLLTFRCDYIYQAGMRDGVSLIAVKYANDSIATRVVRMSSTNEYTLRIDNTIGLGIKEVKGFFYLGQGSSTDATSTMKLMSVYDIRLVRMRTTAKPSDDEKGGDNVISADSVGKTPAVQENNEEMSPQTTVVQPVPQNIRKGDEDVAKPVRMLVPQKMNLKHK